MHIFMNSVLWTKMPFPTSLSSTKSTVLLCIHTFFTSLGSLVCWLSLPQPRSSLKDHSLNFTPCNVQTLHSLTLCWLLLLTPSLLQCQWQHTPFCLLVMLIFTSPGWRQCTSQKICGVQEVSKNFHSLQVAALVWFSSWHIVGHDYSIIITTECSHQSSYSVEGGERLLITTSHYSLRHDRWSFPSLNCIIIATWFSC
jgi:hypothetical protein